MASKPRRALAVSPDEAPDLAELLQEIRALRGDVVALRGELAAARRPAEKSGRTIRAERRHERLRRIAEATGLPAYNAATEIALMIGGCAEAPPGCEEDLDALRDDRAAARTVEGIYRALRPRRGATDVSWLQWKRPG